jgi:hypothetical protein
LYLPFSFISQISRRFRSAVVERGVVPVVKSRKT